MLRRIPFPWKGYGMEKMFGMCSSKLCEGFCDFYERIHDKNHNVYISVFRSSLMDLRAVMCSQQIQSTGAILPSFLGFIDISKIKIWLLWGTHLLQQAVYSGPNRIHCFLICTITTTGGLIFYCDGPVDGCPHDLFMLHLLGLDAGLQNVPVVNRIQFNAYSYLGYIDYTIPWFLDGFATSFATLFMRSFNRSSSRSRKLVELNYKDLKKSPAIL